MTRSWTLIFQDVDATDEDVRSLERVLVAAAAQYGKTIRATTVESWAWRARVMPLEPMRGPATAVEPEHSYRRDGDNGLR